MISFPRFLRSMAVGDAVDAARRLLRLRCSIPPAPSRLGEKTILTNAVGIMLLIVVPTILATIAFAWWFRRGNARAKHRPEWSYSGRLELLVWSVPLLVIIFLGGMGWIGSHQLDPTKPIAAKTPTMTVQVVRARLEMAVHLSRSGYCDDQPPRVARRHARRLSRDVGDRHEQLLRAAAWQSGLCDGGDGRETPSDGRSARAISRLVRALQRARGSRT